MRVLGFDAWTKGSRHFERLVEPFGRAGLEVLLVHVGSLGDEPGRPRRERLGRLDVRDISSYPDPSIPGVLDAEEPDVVVLMSTTSFCHRALIRYCRRRGIPTVHVFHGVQSVWSDQRPALPLAQMIPRLWALRHLAGKHVRHFWPMYMRALWDTKATHREWWRFAADALGRAAGSVPTRAAVDSRADRACVYQAADVDFAVERYGYGRADVVVVGNPDLVTFGITPDMLGECLRVPAPASAPVMYIETAWPEYGRYSSAAYLEHVRTTRDAMDQIGRRLIFKPHPLRTGTSFLDDLDQAGVEVCSVEAFAAKLQGCGAAIVESSSAAIIPALLGLPMFLASFGCSESGDFGNLLRSYPRAIELRDVNAFSALLADEAGRENGEATMAWILRNAGPLPLGDMPEHVAATVSSLAAGNRAPLASAARGVPRPV